MKFVETLGIPAHEFRLIFGHSRIDYDRNKEDGNRRKHGYSLASAAHLLERIMFPIGANVPHAISDSFICKGEVRHMHMSVDEIGKVVLMVTTMRQDETVPSHLGE